MTDQATNANEHALLELDYWDFPGAWMLEFGAFGRDRFFELTKYE